MEYEKFEKDDLLKLQVDMLTSLTENNPDMIYDNSSFYNMALNPNYFKGIQTSIVNAINLIIFYLITKVKLETLYGQTLKKKWEKILL